MTQLYFVYWHVETTGCSAVFPDEGAQAMKFAMNLQRMGYPSQVTKETIGKPDSCEVIHESDDWLPLTAHQDAIENGERTAQPHYEAIDD